MTTLETVPAEVLHAICAHLKPKDVAAIRLTSKVLAEIGAHYLVSQVTFFTSQASLDRLQMIADHTIFRQHVESVHFEANLLAGLCCRSCWAERFAISGHGARSQRLAKPEALKPPSTIREKRAYARNLLRWEEDVNEAYDKHSALRLEQQKLQQQGPELMAGIIPQFPRLQRVIITIGRCQHALSKRFQEDFDRNLGFTPSLSVDTGATASQLKHIVLPGGKPLRDLRSLVVSDLDPSLFDLKGGANIMCQAFTNLRNLDLSFRLPDKIEPSTEPGLYKDLIDGGLRNAICSAEHLEDLRIAFNDFTYDGACVDLTNILGDKSFDHLKSLYISYVEADQDVLIDALKRQKALKYVGFYSVLIRGSWVKVLTNLARDFSSVVATFDGYLTDNDGMYDMEWAEVEFFMSEHEELTIGDAMQCYVSDAFDGGNDEEQVPNPLETFAEDYASRETLNELHAEIVAETGEECDCDRCLEVLAELESDSEENGGDTDDSMPDLADADDDDDFDPDVD